MKEKIVVFYGAESLLIQYRIERAIKESGANEYNITTYDAEEKDIFEAVQDAMTPPFMGAEKVIIVKRPLFLTTEKTAIEHRTSMLIEYLSNPMESTLFLIHAGDIKFDERNAVVKALKKHATFIESKKLTDIEFIGWMKRQLEQEGLSIDDDAAQLFYDMVGKDLNNAQNEVHKLINYMEPKSQITKRIIKTVVVKEMEKEIYTLSNAIMNRQSERIIPLYYEMLESGIDASVLFGSCAKAIRDSYIVRLMVSNGMKQAEIAEKLKITPGRAYYLMRDAKNLTDDQYTHFLNRFAEMDFRIKSGQMDVKTGFEFLLFQL